MKHIQIILVTDYLPEKDDEGNLILSSGDAALVNDAISPAFADAKRQNMFPKMEFNVFSVMSENNIIWCEKNWNLAVKPLPFVLFIDVFGENGAYIPLTALRNPTKEEVYRTLDFFKSLKGEKGNYKQANGTVWETMNNGKSVNPNDGFKNGLFGFGYKIPILENVVDAIANIFPDYFCEVKRGIFLYGAVSWGKRAMDSEKKQNKVINGTVAAYFAGRAMGDCQKEG
jgi:hypothetical protein